MATWATPEQAARHWPDAATLDPARLSDLLEVATDQAATYAPALDLGDPVPLRYTLATVYQAREVYAASIREGDLIGAGDYAFRAVPLTAAVKKLLRPTAGLPVIG
jgi:hypothetical protein